MRQAIAEELHRPARRNYPTRRVELKGINDLYQADLVDMVKYSRINKGNRYLLTIINCFSKFAHAIPIKRKTGYNLAVALAPILKKHKMKLLQVDQGTEFYNKNVLDLMKKYGIKLYSTYSDKKASIIERFNRTLKTKMWRKFTEQGTYKWVDILPKLIKEYNNTVHRSIGMKPVQVNNKNEDTVLRNINKATYRSKEGDSKPKYKVGDHVRISKYKKQFDKGYLPNWSNEIFTIIKVNQTRPVTYILKDVRGETIKGTFYEQEINKTKVGEVYLVEKVLRKKGNKALVRWLGFDSSHDSWVNVNDIL